MCFYYEDSPEFVQDSTPKSRKLRKCDCCYGPIHVGEYYRYTSGKFDGSFFTYACCRRCQFDLSKIAAHELNEGCRWNQAWCNPDDLADYLQETEQERTPVDEVPEWFDIREDDHKSVEKIRLELLSTTTSEANR